MSHQTPARRGSFGQLLRERAVEKKEKACHWLHGERSSSAADREVEKKVKACQWLHGERSAANRRRPSMSPKSQTRRANKKQLLEWLRKKKARSVLWLHGDLKGDNFADDSPRTKRKRAEERATTRNAPKMPVFSAPLIDSPSSSKLRKMRDLPSEAPNFTAKPQATETLVTDGATRLSPRSIPPMQESLETESEEALDAGDLELTVDTQEEEQEEEKAGEKDEPMPGPEHVETAFSRWKQQLEEEDVAAIDAVDVEEPQVTLVQEDIVQEDQLTLEQEDQIAQEEDGEPETGEEEEGCTSTPSLLVETIAHEGLNVEVASFETIDAHIVFNVNVSVECSSWSLQRRYSEFLSFFERVKDDLGTPPVSFPPKLWSSCPSDEQLRERQALLQSFITEVLERPLSSEAWSASRTFFEIPANCVDDEFVLV
jgi:hypothetical protein